MENDFLGELQGYQPETIKDEVDFKPIKGKYVCRIARFEHNIGISTVTNEPYDFYALNMQVVETVNGDRGERRYLTKRYQNNPEGFKKLLNDMFTAGLSYDISTREAFDLGLSGMIDKNLNVSAYPFTPDKKRDGTPLAPEDRETYQIVKIVKEFKLKKGKKEKAEAPF